MPERRFVTEYRNNFDFYEKETAPGYFRMIVDNNIAIDLTPDDVIRLEQLFASLHYGEEADESPMEESVKEDSDIVQVLLELRNLRRWKEEAMQVMDNLQELGQALGVPLGESVTGPKALEAVRVLVAERDTLRKALAELEDGVKENSDPRSEERRFKDWVKEALHEKQAEDNQRAIQGQYNHQAQPYYPQPYPLYGGYGSAAVPPQHRPGPYH